jgi:hypothetical protein
VKSLSSWDEKIVKSLSSWDENCNPAISRVNCFLGKIIEISKLTLAVTKPLQVAMLT